MSRETLERIPMTYDRAATELLQARRHLDDASSSLRLALEIFERLPDDDGLTHPHPGALRAMLRQVEDVERALGVAARCR